MLSPLSLPSQFIWKDNPSFTAIEPTEVSLCPLRRKSYKEVPVSGFSVSRFLPPKEADNPGKAKGRLAGVRLVPRVPLPRRDAAGGLALQEADVAVGCGEAG